MLPRFVVVSMLLLLQACTPPDPADSAPEVDLPAAYDEDGPVIAPPMITAEAATTAMDEVLSSALTFNADVMFQAYAEVMTYADDDCPSVSYGAGGSMWDVNCSSDAGATYSGFVSEFEGMQGETFTRRMRGEATIDLPDGSRMIVAGDVGTDERPQVWSSMILGVMRYDGLASAGTWVERAVDVNLEYSLTESSNDGSLVSVTLEGSVAGLVGEVTAVSFADFRATAAADFPCPIEPTGTVGIRDASGVWASVTFDVVGSAAEGYTIADGACDGCAPLVYDGVELGEVCVDTSSLFAAELPPW